MKLIPGDLTHQVLASSRHHYHHYHSGGGSYGGGIDWWEWLILAVGAGVVIWSLIKKFSSD